MRDDRDDRHEGDPSDRGDRDAADRDPANRDPTDRRHGDSEELDERVADLEARVHDLRDELARPPEGPLGLPRPPTPREVLSFTGEYAIPTAIAVLEANVRALKALEQVIRVLDPERSVVREELNDRDRGHLESRAADASRATLDRLEDALEDVESTIRESDLPREAEARDVLEDARRINREIRDRVERERRSVEESRQRERDIDRERSREDDESYRTGEDEAGLEDGTTIPITDESADADEEGHSTDTEDSPDAADADESADGGVEVDVEAELRSIKDEIERPKGDGKREDTPDAPANEETGDADEADGEAADADESSGEKNDAEATDTEATDAEETDDNTDETDDDTEESSDDRDE